MLGLGFGGLLKGILDYFEISWVLWGQFFRLWMSSFWCRIPRSGLDLSPRGRPEKAELVEGLGVSGRWIEAGEVDLREMITRELE